MKPFFSIGDFAFESYTVVTNLGALIGAATAYMILERTCEREKNYWKLIPTLLILMVITNPIAKIIKGAFGGILAGEATHFLGRVLITVFVLHFCMRFLWKDKKCISQAWNSIAAYFLVQHFFNRLACWLNGCCGGIYLEFCKNYFPSQLFEAVAVLITFFVLVRKIQRGDCFYEQSCMSYAVIIFLSEFFIEQTSVEKIWGFTSVQFAAVILFLFSLINWLRQAQHQDVTLVNGEVSDNKYTGCSQKNLKRR